VYRETSSHSAGRRADVRRPIQRAQVRRGAHPVGRRQGGQQHVARTEAHAARREPSLQRRLLQRLLHALHAGL